MSEPREICFTFACGASNLIGIVHLPAEQRKAPAGVLILVGGPQYRVGPHRQYVHLARHLSNAGIPAMRFDFRGIGDSEGDYPGFESLRADLDAAMSAFQLHAPHLQAIILWGLCEGASSILLDGVEDRRVAGAVLLNPWVRNESSLARTHLKHYYLTRFTSGEFWRRLLGGKADLKTIVNSFGTTLKNAFGTPSRTTAAKHLPFPSRMADGLRQFQGDVLLIQSGRDLVAREFDQVTGHDPAWAEIKARKVERFDIPGADHTFSTEAARLAVAEKTTAWIKARFGG